MKKHWPDCEINNGGKCDCNRKYMTNQPPTIKDVLKELSYIQEKIDHLPLTDEIQQIQCNLLDFSKYLSSYLSEVNDYWLKKIGEIACGEKFMCRKCKKEYLMTYRQGLCSDCLKATLTDKIKKLKGGK